MAKYQRMIAGALLLLLLFPAQAGERQEIMKSLGAIIDAVAAHDVEGFYKRVAAKHFISRFMDDVAKYAFITYPEDSAAEAGMKFMTGAIVKAGLPRFKAQAEKLLLEELKTGAHVTPLSIAAARKALATLKDRSAKNDLMVISVQGDIALAEMGLLLKDKTGIFKVPVRIRLKKQGKVWIVYEPANMQEILTDKRTRALLMHGVDRNLLSSK